MRNRTLSNIRNDIKANLDMAATFEKMGEYEYAEQYRKEALAAEQELESLRTLDTQEVLV